MQGYSYTYIMSKVRNSILVPSYGKDTTKFLRVPAFEKVSNAKLFKMVIPSFRMAGKIQAYVNQNKLAVYSFGSNFNGYGYSTQNNYYLMRPKDSKVILGMLEENKMKRKAKPTHEELDEAWCRRLAKLTGISMEQARIIAEEKLEAQEEQISELEERQNTMRYSIKREQLINKLRRSNPLRRIENEEHAYRILAASVRHNASNYESLLNNAREMAEYGEIDRSEIKQYARTHATYWGNIQSTFFEEDEETDD